MDEMKLTHLKEIFGVLNNTKRLKIIFLCEKTGLTVSQLSKKLNLSYNITSEYIGALAKVGLVKRTRNPDRTVTVNSLVKIRENGELSKI